MEMEINLYILVTYSNISFVKTKVIDMLSLVTISNTCTWTWLIDIVLYISPNALYRFTVVAADCI